MASEPLVTLELEANSARAGVGLETTISRELSDAGLPSTVSAEIVGDLPPITERRSLPGPGQWGYSLGDVATTYVLLKVVVRFADDAGDAVYDAVKRAVFRWRQEKPDPPPIYGPDGKTPIDDWIAEQERRRRDK